MSPTFICRSLEWRARSPRLTPNRFWPQENSGTATPGADGWLELPANRQRVYALWAIVRGWSQSRYAAPSISSALGIGMCSVPFMIVEH